MSFNKRDVNKRWLKMGGYISVVCIAAILITVLFNFLIGLIPGKYVKADTSRGKFYTFTENTVKLIEGTGSDTDIYLAAEYGEEDTYIFSALKAAADINPKIKIHTASNNSRVFENAGHGGCNANSFIVVKGDKSKFVDYADVYRYTVDTKEATYKIFFEFEKNLYSAISYVNSDALPKVYFTSKNGEKNFDEAMSAALAPDNIEYTELVSDKIPEDASAVMISNPSSDLSESLISALGSYMDGGGKIFLCYNGASSGSFPNVDAFLAKYGVMPNSGIILEQSPEAMFSQLPYITLPTVKDTEVLSELYNNGISPIIQLGTGIAYTGEYKENIKLTELCTSSETSFLRPLGSNEKDFAKTSSDIAGPMCVCALIADEKSGGEMIWVTSDSFADGNINTYSENANSALISASVRYLTDTESSNASEKVFGQDALEINDTQLSLLTAVLCLFVPAFVLFAGIYIYKKRKEI